MKYLTTRKAKLLHDWIQDAIGVALVLMIGINLTQVRKIQQLQETNHEVTMALVKANAKLDTLQAASLRGRGQWMHGDHKWACMVSKTIGVAPPPPPPSYDSDVFSYDPTELPE